MIRDGRVKYYPTQDWKPPLGHAPVNSARGGLNNNKWKVRCGCVMGDAQLNKDVQDHM